MLRFKDAHEAIPLLRRANIGVDESVLHEFATVHKSKIKRVICNFSCLMRLELRRRLIRQHTPSEYQTATSWRDVAPEGRTVFQWITEELQAVSEKLKVENVVTAENQAWFFGELTTHLNPQYAEDLRFPYDRKKNPPALRAARAILIAGIRENYAGRPDWNEYIHFGRLKARTMEQTNEYLRDHAHELLNFEE